MIDYRADLNNAQLRAVEFMEGPALVIAGAGSGKTRVLVYRVAHLVEKGINPGSILLLTFTRRASREMMKRAAGILDSRCHNVMGGTFHSFANGILRKYAKKIGFGSNFTILDRDDSEGLINLMRAELEFDKTRERFPKKKTIMEILSKSVNTGMNIKCLLDHDHPHFAHFHEEISAVGQAYADAKKEKSLMDYDDLLVHLRNLLRDNDNVRKAVSNRFKYIMVDEYQDTNRIQGHIVALLASEHENILVVGDDAQSIYSFRGANFRNIMDFPDIFPKAEVITLEENYRSLQPILNLTNGIIANAKEKFSKELFTTREGDQKPVFVNLQDGEAQAEYVCKNILKLREEDVPLNEIAVLFRNSFHSNQLEVELTNRNIPFVKYGGFKFLEAAHVKDVMSFLKTVCNKDDEIAWRRILVLLEGIGEKGAAGIIAKIHAHEKGYPALSDPAFAKKKYARELIKLQDLYGDINPDLMAVAEMIRTFIPFYKPLMKNKFDNYSVRLEDLKTLVTVAENFSSLEEFLTQLTLEPPEKSIVEQEDPDEEKLILSTIHSAKGLEWHTVFILSLLEGFLPDKRCLDEENEIEEERRLFYVAATRAKKNLYLLKPSFIEGRFNYYADPSFSGLLKPSRFLTEFEEFVDLVELEEYEKEEFAEKLHDYDDNYDDDSDYDENDDSDYTMRRINKYYDER